MNLSLLSKYRTELMGFAIICVYLFHMSDLKDMNIIFRYGYMGVDIFILLSGIGLVYSWEKNSNIKNFYIKRFSRIFPAYFIVAVIYLVYKAIFETKEGIKGSIYLLTGLNFWKYGDRIFWYIPSIMALYIIFPLIITFHFL